MAKKKKQPKLVWVIYDPLNEQVICVHNVPDMLCDDCKPIWDDRQGKLYQLEEIKFEIQRYENLTHTE